MNIKRLLGTIALSFLMIFTSFSIPVFQTRAYALTLTNAQLETVNSIIKNFVTRFARLDESRRKKITEAVRMYIDNVAGTNADSELYQKIDDILKDIPKLGNNGVTTDLILGFARELKNGIFADNVERILEELEEGQVDINSSVFELNITQINSLYSKLQEHFGDLINKIKTKGISVDDIFAIIEDLRHNHRNNDGTIKYIKMDDNFNLYIQTLSGNYKLYSELSDEERKNFIVALKVLLPNSELNITYDDVIKFAKAFHDAANELNVKNQDLLRTIMRWYIAPYTPPSGGVGGGVVPSVDEQKNQQAQQVINDLIDKMAEKNNSQAVAALTSVLDTLKGVNVNSDTKAKLLEAINQVIAKVSAVALKSEDGKTYNVSADDMNAFLDANNLSAKLKDIGINDIEVKMPKVFKLKIAANNEADIVLPSGSLKKLGDNNIGVEVERDDVNITLPAGFVNVGTTGDVKLSIAKLNDAQLAPIKEKVQNTEFARQNIVATPYEFTLNVNGSSVSQFNKALTVNMKYDKSTVKDAKKINAYYFDTKDNSWKYIRSKVDINNAQVTFNTAHFTTFALMEYNRTFSDIQNDWAKSDIEYIASKYITDGVGNNKFMPAGKVTRAQFVAFIVRTLGLEPVAYNSEFRDVRSSEWYAQYVATAVKAGIIKGYGDGKFGPNDKVTREQMAAMIMRAYALVTGKSSSDISTTKSFSDMSKVSSWAVNDVKASAELGIIKGYPGGSFGPKDFMLRDQAAGILSRLINITGLY